MQNQIPSLCLPHPAPERLAIEDLTAKCLTIQDPRQIVELVLTQSLYHGASDVHMDNTAGHFTIFFRIHGILHAIASYEDAIARRIIDQVKIKSNITLSEGRSPSIQEGHYSIPPFHTNIPIHIIPFTPLESVVIHLPCPSGGSSINHNASLPLRDIEKKIFIWQMGKVGSASVLNSLKGFTLPTSWEVTNIVANDHWLVHNNLLHTHSIQILYNFLHYTEEEFIVISLVRDLIARNVSSIFESMCRNAPWNKLFIAEKNDFIAFSYEKQEAEITKKLSELNRDEGLLNWYNSLFKSHFYYPDTDRYLIDIYSKNFDHTKGVQTYSSKTKRVKMIIIRLEDLNESEQAIGEFLGIDNFRLLKDNLSKDKWYKPIYEKFLSRYTPPREEINKIYLSKFMQYFYSQSQIDTLIARWTKTP